MDSCSYSRSYSQKTEDSKIHSFQNFYSYNLILAFLEETKQYGQDSFSKEDHSKSLLIRNQVSFQLVNNKQDSDSDEEHEDFLFKSSLKAGSNFLEIQLPNSDDDSEILFTKPGELCILSNTTSDAIVAYYVFSNVNGYIENHYKLINNIGFLAPGDSISVEAKKRYNGLGGFELNGILKFLRFIIHSCLYISSMLKPNSSLLLISLIFQILLILMSKIY